MAYLGKVYTFEKEENYDGFINSMNIPEEHRQNALDYRPSQKLEKDNGGYIFTLSTPQNNKVLKFQSGVQFEDKMLEGIVSKTTITVEGDVLTEVQRYDDGHTFTYKKEFSNDKLVVTCMSNKWDGVARRYYKA